MTELRLDADVDGPPELVFGLITDFGGQDRWLPRSSSFRGTTLLSPGPVALGTRYRESDPFGVRNGTVTRFEPPARVTFDQPMTLRLHAGTIGVTVDYTLTPGAGSTHVTRIVTLGIGRSLRLAQPLLVRAFRRESTRTLLALKAHASRPPRLPRGGRRQAGAGGSCPPRRPGRRRDRAGRRRDRPGRLRGRAGRSWRVAPACLP